MATAGACGWSFWQRPTWAFVANGLAQWLGYLDTELEPAIQAEILAETSRTEARIVILEILAAIVFGAITGMGSDVFRGVAIFALITVIPLLVDSAVRRNAARQLEGIGPRPPSGL